MPRFILLLCFFCVSLYAHYSALTEAEPSSLIEGIASVITGDVYLSEEDIVIEGAEALRLKRNYIGVGRRHTLFPHLFAEFIVPMRMINITEPNGTTLSYFHHPIKEDKKHNKHKKKHKNTFFVFDPIDISRTPGSSNTARGVLSARTNIKNIRLDLHPEAEHLILHCADGTQRYYRPLHNQHPSTFKAGDFKMKRYLRYFFCLHSEELPNGNKILYDWNKHNALLCVRTTNTCQTKTYAQATIHYLNKTTHLLPMPTSLQAMAASSSTVIGNSEQNTNMF